MTDWHRALLDADAATQATNTLARLVVDVPVLDPSTRCDEVEPRFAADDDLTSVLVRHPQLPQICGLLMRGRLERIMAGRYGYGRSLNGRRPVADFAVWDSLALPVDALVHDAAALVITRAAARANDDLVVMNGRRPAGVVPTTVILEALARLLAVQALHDPLTGLANRELFFGRVDESCRRSSTSPDTRTVVVYCDVDRFKSVNDAHGHDAGDAVLVRVADRLMADAREHDVVARLGGDEFAFVLDLPHDAAERLAAEVGERVRLAVREVAEETGTTVRASVGAAASAGAVDSMTLVRAADAAMYRAKRAGGDRVELALGVGAQSSEASGLDPVTMLDAVRNGQFVVHYQPIVELSTGAVVSVEALARWERPEHGLLLPCHWLDIADSSGVIATIDDWVLRETLRTLALWDSRLGAASPRHVNVNVSAARLVAGRLVETVLESVTAAGVDASRLRLEVHDATDLRTLRAATPALLALRDAGVSLAFDDVGGGSTSLRHLRELTADGLKIDRSYVAGMLVGEKDLAVVRLLVDFGVGLGLKVTAEGVETAEHADALHHLGCQYAQGWHFGRPVPAPAMAVALSGARAARSARSGRQGEVAAAS